jgi:hypothetical protein
MGRGEAGYAEAVRAAREAAGKDPGELAAALDMSYESYRDIETYDDEITSVVSFGDAVTLAELLQLDLRRMFGADDTVLTFADLAAAVRGRLGETPLEQLENELGWELADALGRTRRVCRIFTGWTCRRRSSLRARLATSPAPGARPRVIVVRRSRPSEVTACRSSVKSRSRALRMSPVRGMQLAFSRSIRASGMPKIAKNDRLRDFA